MTPRDWRAIHEELTQCHWFSRVGKAFDPVDRRPVRRVASWAEASGWAEAEISWWCVNEASNVLSEFLHVNHNWEYQEWNRHAESFAPALDALLAGPVSAALPEAYRTPGVTDWVRSLLMRAYLECCYSTLGDVRLARDQVAWFLAGHFPCGWLVEDEAGFPDDAVAVVF